MVKVKETKASKTSGVIGFLKDAANGSFIQSSILGNVGKRSPERLTGNVEDQAFGHHVMLVHVRQRLKKGFATGTAAVAFPHNSKSGSLTTNGGIYIELLFDLMPVELGSIAMRTAQRHRALFGGDLVVMFAFIDGQNTIIRPTKNVQEMLSQLKILLDEFSEPLAFLVVKRGCFLQISDRIFIPRTLPVFGRGTLLSYSTHFAG